jgi:lantibiotic modifying enzyme
MTSVLSSPQTWSAILEGEDAERAVTAVRAVAEALGSAPLPARKEVDPTLASGEAGAALLFEYLERAHPGAGYGDIAWARLERATDLLAAAPLQPGLYSGFCGVAWVAEHLQRGAAGDAAGDAADVPEAGAAGAEEEDDANAGIDAALLHHLGRTPWTYHFDLITGLAGYGVYALERLPRAAAVECLRLLVERLAETAAPRPGGLGWHTPFEMLPEPNKPWYPKGLDNLGMAHGTPGVIALLARICERGEVAGASAARARALLRDAVSWLLAQKLPSQDLSVYPYAVGDEVKIRPARAAWCYGDPGIAAALLAAGRALGETSWKDEALALARAVARRPVEACRVEDACLCHGAAGLGHVLNRLYQATGDEEVREGARAWLRRALDQWQPGQGIGGFLAFSPVDDDFDKLEWNDDPGFLNGSAGMALALLAAISAVEPAWDRVLLLS